MPNPIRVNAVQGLSAGDSFAITRTFTKEDTLSFGDLTRDYNPVHYDSRWSTQKGMKGLICHGLLIGSMICEFGGQVGWLATGMDFKFLKPVYFNDTIRCTVTITKIDERMRAEAEAIFTNQEHAQVGHAYLTGRLPTVSERDILQQMLSEDDPTNKLSSKEYG